MKSLNRIRFGWKGSQIELEILNTSGEEGEAISLPLPYVLECTEELSARLQVAPIIRYQESDDQLFYPLVLMENQAYACAITFPGSPEELELKRQQSQGIWPFQSSRIHSFFTCQPQRFWKTETKSGVTFTTISGILQFPHRLGIANLSVGPNEPLFLEVASWKFNYFADYRLLLNDVAEEMVELILYSGESLSMPFQSDHERDEEPIGLLFVIRHLFANRQLEEAISSILRNPHSKLTSEVSRKDLSNVRQPDLQANLIHAASLRFDKGGPLSALFAGNTPIDLFDKQKFESFDSPENRFVKYFLEELLSICQRLLHAFQTKAKQNDRTQRMFLPAIQTEINGWISQVTEWLTDQFWQPIGRMRYLPSNSQVLQKRAGYREVFLANSKLQIGLQLTWEKEDYDDKIQGEIRPIYELYEYWCFFQLYKILVQILGEPIERSNPIAFDQQRMTCKLKKGNDSRIVFRGKVAKKPVQVILYYNKVFQSGVKKESYSLQFQPDYTLAIKPIVVNSGEEFGKETLVHFDAKFRMDKIPKVEEDEEDLENSSTNNRDDLIKMHAYKDAIYSTWGSYILYPGSEKKIFEDHWRGNEMGIGAFPLRPSMIQNDTEDICEFIMGLLQHLIKPGE